MGASGSAGVTMLVYQSVALLLLSVASVPLAYLLIYLKHVNERFFATGAVFKVLWNCGSTRYPNLLTLRSANNLLTLRGEGKNSIKQCLGKHVQGGSYNYAIRSVEFSNIVFLFFCFT